MRIIILIFLIITVVFTSSAQPKKRDKVKRKYRVVEEVAQDIPEVVYRGRVSDIYKNPLKGVSVEIVGLKRKVHTNEDGLFVLTHLIPGMVSIKYSYLGYRTKTIDYVLKSGQNTHYVALDLDKAHFDPLVLTTQKREQHIQDLPSSVAVVSGSCTENLGIADLSELSGLVPGLRFASPGAGSMGFFMQGSAVHAGFPELSPSVAVYIDDVPVHYHNGLPVYMNDIERVEVVKGPQGTLFGNNATGGAIHLISKKPGDEPSGSLTAGAGNFSGKEVNGSVNVPVIEDVIFLRAAGFFRKQNGYIENTPGSSLNGVNNYGGKISINILPFYNHKINLTANYIGSNHNGIGMINPWMPDSMGNAEFYRTSTSLDGIDNKGFKQEFLDAVLTYKIYRSENKYWTSISSYRKSRTSDIWDADGTALSAFGLKNDADGSLFYQEIRFNFSRRSRNNGSLGVSYMRAVKSSSNYVNSNDKFIYEILTYPGNFLMPEDNRFPVKPQPLDPEPMNDFPLSGAHSEYFSDERKTGSYQAYIHLTHQLTRRIFFTGGARASYNRLKLWQEAASVEGSPSVLGNYTGASPNLIYKPSEGQTLTNNSLNVTGQAGLTYRWNENFNFFINALYARKPGLLQFTWDSRKQMLDAETVKGLEAGWKFFLSGRLFFNVTGYYREHENISAVLWRASSGDGLLNTEGKALSYGAESGIKIALFKGLDLFGNYFWTVSTFDSTDVNGINYVYAGNSFPFSPEHSFSAGINFKTAITKNANFFLNPWYTWQSHYWFTEVNSLAMSQSPYGLLNVNTGFELEKPAITVSLYGQNILDENYIAGTGHWGGLLGMPAFIPGKPRMMGLRIKWDF